MQCLLFQSEDELQEYGIDWEGPLPDEANCQDSVEVPETRCPLNQEQFQELVSTIDPLAPTCSYGIDIYLQTLAFTVSKVSSQEGIV